MLNLFSNKKQIVESVIPFHTVIITVGPTYCGKSTLLKETVKNLRKQYKESNIVYLSTDEERKEVLTKTYDRHSKEMLYASKAAFDILQCKLKAAISYPQSLKNHLIFIDSTGFSEVFREEIVKLCKEYQYNPVLLLFNYKDKKDYYKYVPSASLNIVKENVNKFKRKVVNNLNTKLYERIIRLNKREVRLNIRFNSVDYSAYLTTILPTNYKYAVIGDTHCNKKLLKKLLCQFKEVVNNYDSNLFLFDHNFKVILNGDWIDKNPNQLREMIEFLYFLRDKLLFVRGNHESFCYQYLKGNIKDPQELRFKYFDSIPILEKDERLKQMFFELYELSKPFYIHRDFVVHHAPCPTKYIGKVDKQSIKNQIKYRYPQRGELSLSEYIKVLEEHLSFVNDVSIGPYIINGHISVNKAVIKNQHVLLDTRAEEDYYLSAALIEEGKLNIISCKGNSNPSLELPNLFTKEYKQYKKHQFEYIESRINKDRFNYLAGTISPADSYIRKDGVLELESLTEAVNYYYHKGINDLVMQVKRMGSNCTLYLLKNGNSYAVTRKGYRITRDYCDLTELLEKWTNKVFSMNQFFDKEIVILNGELEPWSLLSKDLIDKDFRNLYVAQRTQAEFLKDKQFEWFLEAAQIGDNNTEIAKQTISQIKELKKYYVPLEKQLVHLDSYSKELESYSYKGTPFFTPFTVLKTVDYYGKEEIFPYNNNEAWHLFNTAGCFSFTVDRLSEAIYIKDYWSQSHKELFGLDSIEGVVIKPLAFSYDILPVIKVRNSDYLKLVYGPCYEETLDSFIKTKSVKSKRKVSLKQWQLAMKMLFIPYKDITINSNMAQYVAEMLIEEEKLKELDPRL